MFPAAIFSTSIVDWVNGSLKWKSIYLILKQLVLTSVSTRLFVLQQMYKILESSKWSSREYSLTLNAEGGFPMKLYFKKYFTGTAVYLGRKSCNTA